MTYRMAPSGTFITHNFIIVITGMRGGEFIFGHIHYFRDFLLASNIGAGITSIV